MTHNIATSLEQIADELDRLAEEQARRLGGEGQTRIGNASHSGAALAFRKAATLVRNTRLADPAMDAMVQLVIQYRDDLRRPPAKDSIERRLAGIDAALKLAKDNGHAR